MKCDLRCNLLVAKTRLGSRIYNINVSNRMVGCSQVGSPDSFRYVKGNSAAIDHVKAGSGGFAVTYVQTSIMHTRVPWGLTSLLQNRDSIRDVVWLGPPAPKVLGSDSKTTSRIQMLRHLDYYNL